jgi:hypothetical protein
MTKARYKRGNEDDAIRYMIIECSAMRLSPLTASKGRHVLVSWVSPSLMPVAVTAQEQLLWNIL